MKRLFTVFVILFSVLVVSCRMDNPVNFGDYILSEDITVSYNGYNSSLLNIDKLNTDTGVTIKLYGGDSSFEHLIFNFNEEKYIKNINIKFSDSFSSPDENCYFSVLYNNSKRLHNYTGSSKIGDFNNMQQLEINQTCNNIKLFFSSNESKRKTRTIQLFSIEFLSD